ncbi:hypothetical protein C8U37_10465 [Trichococcus patagoniensis]|uniref:Uncharacterized protein n=1 Tax=Trichococcus patagoniensis TaxID=382641 RepID=A0A2T5INM8_9LACT|nr:hypothetical protein C8U37_10465 [Trichococcus patagoniensis]
MKQAFAGEQASEHSMNSGERVLIGVERPNASAPPARQPFTGGAAHSNPIPTPRPPRTLRAVHTPADTLKNVGYKLSNGMESVPEHG